MPKRVSQAIALFSFTGIGLGTALAQPIFELPQVGATVTSLYGASGDGSRIIFTSNQQGAIWDAEHGRRPLPQLSNEYSQNLPYSISTDGRYLGVHHVRSVSPARQSSLFDVETWTYQATGFYNGTRSVDSFGISPDGGTLAIAVASQSPLSVGTWRPSSGFSIDHTFSPNELVVPTDAAGEGEAVVGYSWIGATTSAFSTQGGFHRLTGLSPNDATRANAVSINGNIIVGQSGIDATAWVNEVPIALPYLNGSSRMDANCMTLDGSVIGGIASQSGGTNFRAWFWTAETGCMYLDTYLNSHGLTVPALKTVNAITEDRRTFIGLTTDNRIYRATLETAFAANPIPAPCVAVLPLMVAVEFSRRRRR